MINERYLEYFALKDILDDNTYAENITKNRPQRCDFWYSDGTWGVLDLTKLKARLTELQREFLKDYLLD
jgi:hypothetical protein